MLDTDFRNKQAPLHPVWGSLLHTAAAERAPQCLRYLLTRADQLVEAQNERGETALMLVAKHGDLSMAEQLLKRGGQINRQGWTPLHYAAAFDQRLMVDWLLDRDAYIDAESPALAMHLVRQGADVSYRSHAGLTAMDYAQQMGRDDFAAWLLDRIR
jgi:ankyrin repeat protein